MENKKEEKNTVRKEFIRISNSEESIEALKTIRTVLGIILVGILALKNPTIIRVAYIPFTIAIMVVCLMLEASNIIGKCKSSILDNNRLINILLGNEMIWFLILLSICTFCMPILYSKYGFLITIAAFILSSMSLLVIFPKLFTWFFKRRIKK